MPAPASKASELYKKLIQYGYTAENIGSEEEFTKKATTKEGASKLHSVLLSEGYTTDNLGDVNEFTTKLISASPDKKKVSTTEQSALSEGLQDGGLESTTSTTETVPVQKKGKPAQIIVGESYSVEPFETVTPPDNLLSLAFERKRLFKEAEEQGTASVSGGTGGAAVSISPNQQKLDEAKSITKRLADDFKIDDKGILSLEKEIADLPSEEVRSQWQMVGEDGKTLVKNTMFTNENLSKLRQTDYDEYINALNTAKVFGTLRALDKKAAFNYGHNNVDTKELLNKPGDGMIDTNLRNINISRNNDKVSDDIIKNSEISYDKKEKLLKYNNEARTGAINKLIPNVETAKKYLSDRLAGKEFDVTPSGDNLYSGKKQHNRTEDIDNYSTESIEKLLDPNDPYDARALQVYKYTRSFNDAIKNSSNIEEAAINYVSGIDPTVAKQRDMLMADGRDLPQIQVAEYVKAFLDDDRAKELARTNPDFKEIYYQAKNGFSIKYPEYAAKVIAEKISQEREDRGMNNVFINIPTKSSTREIVDDLVAKGELSEYDKELYLRDIDPKISVGQSLLRGTVGIPFGAFTGKSPISTPGVLENALDSYNKTIQGTARSIEDIPLMPIATSDTYRLQQSLVDNYSTLKVNLTKAHEISEGTGHLIGFTIPMIYGGTALKAAGASEKAAHLINTALMFEGQNRDRALQLFPGDPAKRLTFTAISTAVDTLLTELIPTKSIRNGISNLIKKDVADITNKLATNQITKEAAGDLLIEKTMQALPKFALENAKTAGTITGFGVFHKTIESLMGASDLSAADIAYDAVKEFKQNYLLTPILTLAAIKGKDNSSKLDAKLLMQMASAPEGYKQEIINYAQKNNEPAQVTEEKLRNLDNATKVFNDLSKINLTEPQKEKYFILSVAEKALMDKSMSIDDINIKEKYLKESEKYNKQKERILNNKDKASEYDRYEDDIKVDVEPKEEVPVPSKVIPEIKATADSLKDTISKGGEDAAQAQSQLDLLQKDPVAFFEKEKANYLNSVKSLETETSKSAIDSTIKYYDELITKIKAYDTKNIEGLPGEVGVGEKPVEAKPVEVGGAQETGGGGVLQENVPSGEGKVAEVTQGEVNALKDVSTTAKALQEFKDTEIGDIAKPISESARDEYYNLSKEASNITGKNVIGANEISEAYHKAKAENTNPDFVKSVEDLLSKKAENVPTARKEVSGAVQPTPEVPEGQKVEGGVQPSAEPISTRRTEAEAPVLEKTKTEQIGEGLLSHLGMPVEEKEVKFSKTTGEQKIEGTLEGKPVTFIKNPENLEVINGFYSPIEKRLLETKIEKQSANKWKEVVGKGDEAKYTGVLGWLESLPPTQQVSKSEIQNWMKDNRIEINEVIVPKEKTAKERYKTSNQPLELPGEKTNYKEVLVTLPFKKSTKLPEGYTTEFIGGKYRVFDEEQSLIGEGKTEQEAIADALNEPETAEKPVFKSSHYDEPNIIVHLRMNTRTDANGNKVLFIEELQSDWGQKGKREGFNSPYVDNKLENWLNGKREEDSVFDELIDKYSIDTQGDEGIESQLEYELEKQKKGVPTAPYVMDTNAWTKLAWKVALKEAVKEGADKITWTTGEQQNDRYDLRKQVDEILWEKDADGTYAVSANKSGNTISQESKLTPQKLAEAIGKDAADKIVNNTEDNGVLEGDDLAVGGTGMKGFYGSTAEGKLGIVGNVAKSLFKQEPSTTEINGQQQHSIDITPEMKAQVESGMPKFSKRRIQETTEVLTSKENKEKEIVNQMNSMDLVNKGVDLSSPSTTKEKIDINELNSRLDNPLDAVKWEDYEGIPFTFTISDQLRTGDIKNPNTGEVITDLKGGIGFNGTKGNENNAWANTTKEEAEGMLQRAKDVYENNKPLFDKLWKEGKLPDGHIPMAVVKMAETSILSNEAVFRTGIQNIETLPKSNRKKAVSELAKSMKAKIDTESKALKRGVDKNGKPYTENTIKQKKKSIVQYQKILDAIKQNKYDDIVDVLKDKDNFSLPEKAIIANEIFYGSPTPIGGKEIDITRSRPNTPVSKVLIGNKNPALINLGKITDLLTEPSMKNVPNMHIVSIVGVDVKNPKVNEISHTNYPYGVKGKSIGVLESPVHMKDAFGEAYGSTLSQIVKNEADNASISVKNALTQGIPVQSGLPNRVFKSAIAKGRLDAVDKLSGFLRQAFPNTTFFTSKEAWDAAMADPSVKKKLKDGDVVYAFTTDGNIFINPELKTTKATLHETGHIWTSFVKENNPELHQRGLDLVSNTKEHQRAINEYGDTELAREEALMELMSTKGETILNAAQKAQFKEWLLTVYKYISENFKSLMGLSPKEIENLTLDKFLEGMLSDILSGKELTTKKLKSEAKFSLESQNARIKDYIESQRKSGETDADIRAGIESVADKLKLSKEDIDALMKGEIKTEVPVQENPFEKVPKTQVAKDKYFDTTFGENADKAREIYNQGGTPAEMLSKMKTPIVDKGKLEGDIKGITMEDNAQRREAIGMEERKPNPESVEQWRAEAQKRIADGYNINKLIEKMESGEPTDKIENEISRIFAATLDEIVKNNPTNENIRVYQRLINAREKASSEIGRSLRSLQGMSNPYENISDFYVAMKESVSKENSSEYDLTEAQIAETKAYFESIQAAKEEYRKKYEEVQAKFAEMQAQNELLKQQKELKSKAAASRQPKDYVAERQSLKERLKQAIEKYKNNANKMGIASDGGAENFAITVEMAKIISQIAKSHVEEVGAKLVEVTRRTLDDVKDLFDGITDKDIRDIIAGKYSERKETKSELAANLRQLKAEAGLLNELDRVIAGEPKTEKARVEKNQRLAEIRRQINEVKKNNGLEEYSTESRIEKATEAAKKNIKELEDKIANNELDVKNAEKVNSPELEALRKKQKQLRDELEAKRKETGTGQYSEEARAKKAIEANKRRQREIEERIANNDFDAPEKRESIYDSREFKMNNKALYNELLDSQVKAQEAELEFHKKLVENEMANMGKMDKFKQIMKKGGGTLRAIFAGIDDSAVGVQNWFRAVRNPVIGAKAIQNHILDFWSQKRFDRYLSELHNSADYNIMKESGLQISEPKSLLEEGKEEMFPTRFRAIIKLNGKEYGWVKVGDKKYELFDVLKPFERAFTSLGNSLRVISFRTSAAKLEAKGITFENNPEEYKKLARRINAQTSASQPNKAFQSEVTNLVIWSPRLMTSKLNILGISDLVSYTPIIKQGYYRSLGEKGKILSRQQLYAAYDLAQFAASVVAGSYLFASARGGAVNTNPFDDNFMDVEMPNGKSYNFTGGFSKYIATIFQITRGGKVDRKTGLYKEYPKFKDRGSEVLHFMRGKMPPISGSIVNLFTGKDYTGKETSLSTEAERYKMPMAIAQISKQIDNDGYSSLFGDGIPTFLGISVKDKRDYELPKPLFDPNTDLQLPEFKFLKEKGIEIPELSGKDKYKIDKTVKHPDGVMTTEEFDIFKDLVNKYMKEGFLEKETETKIGGIAKILNTRYIVETYDKEGELKKEKDVLGKNLTKEQLESKLDELKSKVIKKVKEEMMLVEKKEKIVVTKEE